MRPRSNYVIDEVVAPMLFKKTSTGAVQFWVVSSFLDADTNYGIVETTYGQVGTPNPQTTSDEVRIGKNIGRSNETTPLEQARLQAIQCWNAKQKEGYVFSVADAATGKTGLPGVKPMLAQKFEDHEAKLTYPAYLQPKLDGFRCLAVVKQGICTLYSRTQKELTSVPHIKEYIESFANGRTFTLDGELYTHGMPFNDIQSICGTKKGVHDRHREVQYYVYDFIPLDNETSKMPFQERYECLREIIPLIAHLRVVPCHIVRNRESIKSMQTHYLGNDYEGVMIRLNKSPYEHKRSKNLLKLKEFITDEFLVVGVEEGSGKLMGHAGSFECVTHKGSKFSVKMEGELKHLKEYFEFFASRYAERMLTVRFFEYTEDGVPRFPVGVGFRDETDLL